MDADKAPIRADYVEKREIDRSIVYSFDGPIQLLHADIGNLEFLGKNATFPQYVLVIVDLYSSKVYTCLMKSRNQILQKMKFFYDEVRNKKIRGDKAFAAEQKTRELKTRIAKLNAQKLKISPTKIIQNSTLNMNLMKSVKYGLSPEEIEQRSLAGERFTTIFNMHRIEKTEKIHHRWDAYDVKK